jgi:uncharacterized protein (DUF58 family)
MRPATQETQEQRKYRQVHHRYLQPSDLVRLKDLQFAARLIVEGYLRGRHPSKAVDLAHELTDHRAYVDGDDARTIDWRVTARTDRHYVKMTRRQCHLNGYVLVDTSKSMAYCGDGTTSKLDYARCLAAGLSYLMVRQGDRVGVALCDDTIQSFVPAGATPHHLQRVLVALERAVVGGPTDLPAALKALFGMIRDRGLVVVISDFLDDSDRLFESLGRFIHRGFSVLLLQVLTDAELDLPAVQNATFLDLESPEAVAAEPDAIRVAYQAELQVFLRDLESRAHTARTRYRLLTTSEPYSTALEAYFMARRRH